MLYVDIIVKQRSKVEELTYAVPASMVPYIRSGSLVTAPLRRRVVEGIVVALRRTVSRELKPKIKPLSSIQRGQSRTEAEIAVMRQLAQYYGASLGEVGFHALDQPYTLPASPRDVASARPVFLQLSAQQRFETYQRLITKHRRTSFVCIFAQRSFLDAFVARASTQHIEILIAEETVRFRKTLEQKIAEGERYVVAATSSGAFLPLPPGGGLIVDQPSHIGLKQQQRPYMRVKTIARIRAGCEQLRLIYGDDLPETSDIVRFQKKEWLLRTTAPALAPVTVASRLRSSEVLLPSVLDRLQLVAGRGGRCLVVALARGWASALVCRECGHLVSCPNCNRTLAVDRGRLMCRYDDTRLAVPNTCPECKAGDLHEVGEGVARIRSVIDRSLPGVVTVEVSSDQPVLPDRGVVVATEKALSFPVERYDLVVLASVDRLLGGVALDDRWELARMMRQLGAITDELVVQTFRPEDPLWAMAVGDLRSFFQAELAERRRWQLPPYGQLASVVAHGTQRDDIQKAASAVRQQILTVIPGSVVGAPTITPLGPKRLRVSITFTTRAITSAQKRSLAQSLPFAWHIDVEP